MPCPPEAESAIVHHDEEPGAGGIHGQRQDQRGKTRLPAAWPDVCGQTISRIFETKGEPFFRQQERALVRELASFQDRLIATGGGIVLDGNNVRDFSRTSIVICCWVDARVAYERTKDAKHRPLLGTDSDRLARIEKLLHERESPYKAISNRIDTSAMSVEQQADEIVRMYKQQTGA
jgi:shikimate kinase